MNRTSSIFENMLLENQDINYRDFNAKLIPNREKESFIGVRTPILRKLAKELYVNEREKSYQFLESLPHFYYEELNLHLLIIEQIKDYDEVMSLTEKALPHIDNWASCDIFMPKVFKKYPEKILEKVKFWIKPNKIYTVRYAIGVLLNNYLDKYFKPNMLSMVAEVDSGEYYINMMRAWYFCEALVKQYDYTIEFFTEKKLDRWTHNKAIQKCIESRRISEDTKQFLRTLKV